MSEVSVTGVVQAEYEYNAIGRQVRRGLTQAGQIIHVVHDLGGNRLAEYLYDDVAQTSSLIREYVWMDGLPVAVIEGGVVYFVRRDHIGRPVFATDSFGTKVRGATYLPFGGVHTSTGANIYLRFPGRWFQSESGLHQNWMRDYDPTLGRYIGLNAPCRPRYHPGMAKLYFHYSTMNAGKSTLLLQASYNYRERGMQTYLMTAKLDNRAGQGRIVSRIGIADEADLFEAGEDLFGRIADRLANGNLDCVFIDEAQFRE